MCKSFHILEKPEWVTWDEIHEVLVKAHAKNRDVGIVMRKPGLPGREIEMEIGDDGVMLVALDGEVVVGCAALIPKSGKTWYNDGIYGYMCFAGILPEYSGIGIYKQFCERREAIAREMDISKLCFDTHENNYKVIEISLNQGFKKVAIKICKDHNNIVLFKWMDGCPFSNLRCMYEFNKDRLSKIAKGWLRSQIKKWKKKNTLIEKTSS